MTRKNISYEIVESIVQQSVSMRHASEIAGIPYGTFIRYAKKFGLYNPNQGLQGGSKPWKEARKKTVHDYIGQNVSVSSARFKTKLFEAGLLKEQCSECDVGPIWNSKKLVLQLDHIDGNNKNNLLSNLRILCPNCHSQTPTFCRGQGKNYADVV